MLRLFHKVLEKPLYFNTITRVFAIGGREKRINESVSGLFNKECMGEVLEIGSGTGQFSYYYLKHLGTYTATDINLDYLRYSKKKVGTIKYVTCDSSMLPFSSQSFDRVFALFMFHHLSGKMSLSSLREMKRCLKKHGKIVIIDPFVPENRMDFVGRLLAKMDRGRWIRKRGDFCRLLKHAGLRIDAEMKMNGSWPYNMWTYILSWA